MKLTYFCVLVFVGILLGAFGSSCSYAFEGTGKRLASWQRMPVAISDLSTSDKILFNVSFSNLDPLIKSCEAVLSIELKKDGQVKKVSSDLHAFDLESFSAHEWRVEFSRDPDWNVVNGAARVGLSCYGLSGDGPTNTLPKPSTGCHPIREDCDHVCLKATAAAQDCTVTAKQKLKFNPKTHLSVATLGDQYALTLRLENTLSKEHTCGAVLVVPAKRRGSSTLIHVSTRFPNFATKPGENISLKGAFSQLAVGEQGIFLFEEASLAATCVEAPSSSLPADVLLHCDPLKKPECNWVEVIRQ